MKIKRKNGLNNCLYLSYFNKYYGLSIVLLNTFVLFLVYDESNLDYKMYIFICVIIILNLLIIYFSFIFHIKVDFDKYKMLIREKLFFHIREIDLSLVYNIEFMKDKIIINGEYGVIYETESKFSVNKRHSFEKNINDDFNKYIKAFVNKVNIKLQEYRKQNNLD